MTPPLARPEAARGRERRSDAELMQRLAQGDREALGELYDRYREPLRRFVARATADAEDVDDLVQSTFLEAASSAQRFDGRASCRPWLIGIAVQLLRRRRQRGGRLFAVLASFAAGVRAASADPQPLMQARCDIARALMRLGETKRMTFLMAEVERMSCAEIAAALGVPIGTVWTRLHAARRELRRALQEGEP